jgi:hypothetical protein
MAGYQVCQKWLKDRQPKGGQHPRPGLVLDEEDIAHYQKIVVVLNKTIRIMAEIDEVIEANGGWPDAFQVGNAKVSTKYEEPSVELPMAAEELPPYGDKTQ